MISSREDPRDRSNHSIAALRPGIAAGDADVFSPPEWFPSTGDMDFPLSSFSLEKHDFASSANVVAMKTAGWLAVGLRQLFGPRSRGRPGILTYHRVSPVIRGLPPPTHNVPPDRFRQHLTGLLDRGFTIRPLRELLRRNASGEPLPPQTMALTFDDGFQSNYTEAFPVLRELRVPATIFVATGYLDGTTPFPFDAWGLAHGKSLPPAAYRPLTVVQCREMLDSGLIDIGAHTHTHRDMRGRPEEFCRDVRISADFLRATFTLSDVMFAFPFGAKHSGFAGSEMAAAARRAGVTCGLTTECSLIDPGSDPFEWGRFNAFTWDTAATLAAKLDGWYTWAARVKRAARQSLRT
jgi:peptidoglycan/xylan/chitin deacetylase (PgdA/CDA1 family)